MKILKFVRNGKWYFTLINCCYNHILHVAISFHSTTIWRHRRLFAFRSVFIVHLLGFFGSSSAMKQAETSVRHWVVSLTNGRRLRSSTEYFRCFFFVVVPFISTESVNDSLGSIMLRGSNHPSLKEDLMDGNDGGSEEYL